MQTPEQGFWNAVHDRYPYLTNEQSTTWVREMCAIFSDGFTLADMPATTPQRHDQYMYLLLTGVPVYCPKYAGVVG